MSRAALVGAVLAAASCDTTPEPYRAIAIAELAPTAAATGRPTTGPLAEPISGPLELLATGDAGPPPQFGDAAHVVAAYRVALPDGAAPWIRIFAAPSCDAPGDDPPIVADLGLIRRVDGETHFFTRHVEVGGRLMDVDTQVAASLLQVTSPGGPGDYAIGKLAVAQVPGDDTLPTGPGGGSGSGGGSGGGSGSAGYPPGGAWLACGAFVAP